MIAPDSVLTAAHCVPDVSFPHPVPVSYYRPGSDPANPEHLYAGNARAYRHGSYNGTSAFEGANHDVAVVKLEERSRWPKTDYHDYLRIYTRSAGDIGGRVDTYGQGYETLSGPRPIGSLVMPPVGSANGGWQVVRQDRDA